MAYVLDGGSGEEYGFTTAISNFALRAMHESIGLVNLTNVVAPTQGNQFLVPNFQAITYQDYLDTPETSGGWQPYGGNSVIQNPALTQSSITASPAVATTSFSIFYGWTTSFQLAATLGAELGESFAEKVDQRVAQGFLGVNSSMPPDLSSTTGFKATAGNTYVMAQDGYNRVSALGAMELAPQGALPSAVTAGFTCLTVLEMIRNVKQNWKVARLPGNPVIVIDSNGNDGVVGSTLNRLLSELTGAAVGGASSGGSNLSALGNELLASGKIENIYGCQVMATTFLKSVTRTIYELPTTVLVGAYFGDSAMFTVLKEGLQIKSGEVPGGLQMWLTGVGYMGSGVGDIRRGGAINIAQG